MEYINKIEKSFNPIELKEIFYKNYLTISFISGSLYLLTLRYLTKFMEKRPAYNLKNTLILWNTFLSTFSIIATIKVTPGIINTFKEEGFKSLYCSQKLFYFQPYTFWGCAFTISKIFEFFDTVLLILRKKPVIFLHWYHHVFTMFYCFHMLSNFIAGTFINMYLNAIVHSFMYTYYTVAATKLVRIPKFISISLTSIQILQFILDTFGVLSQTFYYATSECSIDLKTIVMSLIMFVSYWYLFSQMFVKKYLNSKPKNQ